MLIQQITFWVWGLLALVGFVLEVWALAHAATRPAAAFEAAFKRTKGFWLAVTAACAFVGLLTLPFVFPVMPRLFMIIAVIPACVYLADVRPAVTEHRGGSSGPYGPW